MSKTPVQILNETELRAVAKMDVASLGAVERAFVWLSEDKVSMPPIMHIDIAENNGDVDIKSAFVSGCDTVAVKVAAGFFDNPKIGLPSSSGMVVAVCAKTGRCKAVFLDNAYLTDLRTGLAGAVAAKHLARKSRAKVCIVGAGVQARFQLEALALVQPISHVTVTARSADKMERYCAEMHSKLGLPVTANGSIEDAFKDSDIIITTTPSKSPLVQASWLRPGQHITAIGSDLPGKTELDPDIVRRADSVVCDKIEQCRTHGELQFLQNEQALIELPVKSLGAVILGQQPGRMSDEDITLCDLTGIGVQDTAIAHHVLTQLGNNRAGFTLQT